jgi:signal transduction histidine kinase/CheY-like chemotaxis protein
VPPPVSSLTIRYERDVVLARQHARRVAERLGFDRQDQVRIATAVSEIARNAYEYARGGHVEFQIEGGTSPQLLVVRVRDEGPGIADVGAILAGRYQSPTGMGVGIVGARRLMDQFELTSAPGRGTTVVLKRLLPRGAGVLDAEAVRGIAESLRREAPSDPFEEVQRQNQELLRTLEELGRRQEELTSLNRELEDTNRGVVALYAELDEKADHLRRADDLKSRFLSNMTHEFRTPVNSILALSRMLLERTDGDLTLEQERQVTFVRKAAESLSELVNDLLDLAKVEAGKVDIRPVAFEVERLFGALRGMLRPLLASDTVALNFDDASELPPLYTDEAKVSQILRNFVSNALKFTESGEVRVSADLAADQRAVVFSVADTGIGIAPEDQERIFEEFSQIDSPLQRRVRGTGLGLPLCRKLAGLLGGRVEVESTLGLGSTFRAVIPIAYEAAVPKPTVWDVDPARIPILVVEDSTETVHVYERMLSSQDYQVLAARSVHEARHALSAFQPRAILLDIALKGEDSWELLAELKRSPATRDIPIAVITTVEDERKALALGADAFCLKPIDRQRLLQVATRLLAPERVQSVLVADDEEVFRYVLRQHLGAPHRVVYEASSGGEALDVARRQHPDVICLDLGMPDLDGGEVLRQLKADPDTAGIPVVIVTARPLRDEQMRALRELAAEVIPKEAVSRETALAAVDAAVRAGKAA